jgi:myo-inositol 2-dehydrogenase/D-chiro-inositol 1-dehydrogenase
MGARPRIGLIGCGRIGLVHLRSLISHPEAVEFVSLVDANETAVHSISEKYGLKRASTDVSDIFDDPSIDAIIIASSTETHAPYIQEAARTGKDVLTEKPIALDLESTDRALADVQSAGVRLQVGFQRRFDTGYASAKSRILEGQIGGIEMIRDAMRDPAPPPADYLSRSGGLYRDMTIHNFDCVRWLKGEDPVEIHAIGSALTGPEVEAAGDIDTSVVMMKFADGSLATIENSRRSGFGYDVRTEIFGSLGAIMVGDARDIPIRQFDATGVHEDHQHFFLERFAHAYEGEVLSFVDAIANETDVTVTGEDGRAALVLAFAAEEAHHSNRPVRLTMMSDEMPTTAREEVPTNA